MSLQVAPVHVVGKPVVGGEEKVDGIELGSLGQGGRHVGEGLVEVVVGVVPGPALLDRADAPQSLGVGGGSSYISLVVETFL